MALSNVVHTQTEHARFGGVVPEVASRAHLERLDGVVQKSLSDAEVSLDEISSVAVTVRPGLIGALLVGVAAAKGLAYARALPLVPVNHLEGHVAAAYLTDPDLQPPFVALIASGGHTALYSVDRDRKMRLLGETLDDAAGEALDKGARMLGLGFPGGPAISKAARDGDRDRYDFPVGLNSKDNLDFSFSGLKSRRTWLPVTRLPSSRPYPASSFGPWISTTRPPLSWQVGSPPTPSCAVPSKNDARRSEPASSSLHRSYAPITQP